MKKILICLMLMALPCQAIEVNRLQKELSDACLYTLTTNHTFYDTYRCLGSKTMDDNLWRPGWSKVVNGKIMLLVGEKKASNQISTMEEQMSAEFIKMSLVNTFGVLMQELDKQGIRHQKYTKEELSKIMTD